MDIHTITEQSYKNGYEKGKKETAEKSIESINNIKKKFIDGRKYKEAYKSCRDDFYVQGYIQAIYDCMGELTKQFGVKIDYSNEDTKDEKK